MPVWAGSLRWDWPWLAHLAPYAAAVSAALQRGHSVARLLNELAGQAPPVRFVDQSALPPGQAYEAFIHARRACPTRFVLISRKRRHLVGAARTHDGAQSPRLAAPVH